MDLKQERKRASGGREAGQVRAQTQDVRHGGYRTPPHTCLRHPDDGVLRMRQRPAGPGAGLANERAVSDHLGGGQQAGHVPGLGAGDRFAFLDFHDVTLVERVFRVGVILL